MDDTSFDLNSRISRPHSDPDVSTFAGTAYTIPRRNSAPTSIARPAGEQKPVSRSTERGDRHDVHRVSPLADPGIGSIDGAKDTHWPLAPTDIQTSSGTSPRVMSVGAESAVSQPPTPLPLRLASDAPSPHVSAESVSKRIETLGFMTCNFRMGRHNTNQVELRPEGDSNATGHILISDARTRFYGHWKSDPKSEELDRGGVLVVPTVQGRCHLASIENPVHQGTDDLFLYFSGDATYISDEMPIADIPDSLETCNGKYQQLALEHL